MNKSIIEIIEKIDNYENNDLEKTGGKINQLEIYQDNYYNEFMDKMGDLRTRVTQLKDDEEMMIEVTDFNDNIMNYDIKKDEMMEILKDFNALNATNNHNQVNKHYYMMMIWMVIGIILLVGVILTLSSDEGAGPFVMIIILLVTFYGGFSIIKHILTKRDK